MTRDEAMKIVRTSVGASRGARTSVRAVIEALPDTVLRNAVITYLRYVRVFTVDLHGEELCVKIVCRWGGGVEVCPRLAQPIQNTAQAAARAALTVVKADLMLRRPHDVPRSVSADND